MPFEGSRQEQHDLVGSGCSRRTLGREEGRLRRDQLLWQRDAAEGRQEGALMLTSYVALISELPEATLPFAAVTEVAAAIDKQVTRDFGPLWTVDATVSAF